MYHVRCIERLNIRFTLRSMLCSADSAFKNKTLMQSGGGDIHFIIFCLFSTGITVLFAQYLVSASIKIPSSFIPNSTLNALWLKLPYKFSNSFKLFSYWALRAFVFSTIQANWVWSASCNLENFTFLNFPIEISYR
jgi:hypothetical protein